MQPNFLFVVVLWGTSYAETFLRYCLPSQLAPGNLPELASGVAGRSRYRMYTTRPDAEILTASPVFAHLQRLVDVEFIYLEEFDQFNRHWRATMTQCHAHAISDANRDDRHFVLFSPDIIFSDNSLGNLLKLARAGKSAVMAGTLTVVTETFYQEFNSRYPLQGTSLSVPARDLIRISCSHLNNDTLGWHWKSDTFFGDWPSFIYWAVPGEGVVEHGFHLSPVMLYPKKDEALVYEPEPHMLGIDATDYLKRALPDLSSVYIVQDSDEFCFIHLKPLDPPFPPQKSNLATLSNWARQTLNPLQLHFFKHKIRLHYTDCSPAWDAVERETDQLVNSLFASLRHMEMQPMFAAGLESLMSELVQSRAAIRHLTDELQRGGSRPGNTGISAASADAFFQMGTWFLQYQLPLQAEAAFIKACEVAPNLPDMHRKIIGVYKKNGDEAGAHWHTQLSLGVKSNNELLNDRARIQANRTCSSEQLHAATTGAAPAPVTAPASQSARQEFKTENYPHYPFKIPAIEFRKSLDMISLELPPRHMPMMPNGLGYVHNILRATGISYQTVDCNIIMYHRFHARLFAGEVPDKLPSGAALPADCWDILSITKWSDNDFLDYFSPDFDEITEKLIAAAPRILGISLNGQNIAVASRISDRLKAALPDLIILVGGHSCVHHEVGPHQFNYYDYMFIGEAELTLPPLISALMRNERPKDLAGVISRFDTPGRQWVPAPRPEDLDAVCFPTYDWTDISIYQSCDGGHTVPIAASRGCHWSRCNFCAERFAYRKRKPERVLEEIAWMISKGFHVFHFNESDVNGDPDNLAAICEGIIRQNMKVILMGQLRIHRRSTLDYFKLLKAAGFTDLRFGVDAWSDHALKLQRKGYTMDMVAQNLRDCHAAGIKVAVNMIIGVPGETDEDVEEYIRNIRYNKDSINSMENVNTLILSHGSEYYAFPERFNIHFVGDREKLYKEHIAAIPTEFWYSTEPFIDQAVRIKRMQHVIQSLRASGMKVGSYAEQVIHNLGEAE